MATEKSVTGLYPISPENFNGSPDQINKRLFFLKSSNVKVFPSSWRGARLITTGDGLAAEQAEAQFDIEAALNTEYNITHTAGAIKTCIDEISTRIDIETGKTLYSFKFYLNGYLFEITDLDVSRYFENPDDPGSYTEDKSLPENLYAYIRVGNLINDSLYEASIDFNRVLMPFSWTDLTSPTQLDATINTIYSMTTPDWNTIYKAPIGGINPETLKEDAGKAVYLFTGIVLTTDPSYTAQNDSLTTGDDYYKIQLVIDGQLNKTLAFPANVKAGQAENKSSTVIGKPGLIAEDDYSVAVGSYNDPTKNNNETNLFAVGNGHNNNWRRNVLNVTGYTDPIEEVKTVEETYIPRYSQTVSMGPLKVHYNSELESKQLGATIDNLYTINKGVEVAADGSHLIINQITEENPVGKDTANAGIHLFGDINILGDNHSLIFKETPTKANSSINQKVVATLDIIKTTNGKGLSISNLRTINDGMITFRANAGSGSNNSVETINRQISIAPDGQTITIGVNSDIGTFQFGSDNNTALSITRTTTSDGSKRNSIKNIHKLNDLTYSTTTDSVTIKSGKNDFTLNSGDNFTLTAKDSTILDTDEATLKGNLVVEGDIIVEGSTIFKKPDGDNSGGSEILTENVGLQRAILDLIYPINSIYMSMDSINPKEKFGGTWEQISQGRVLVGAGTNGTKTFKANTIGGQYNTALKQHTHSIAKQTKIYVDVHSKTLTPAAHIFSHTHNVTSAPASGAHSHKILTSDYIPSSDSAANKAYVFDRLKVARRVMVGYSRSSDFNSPMLTGIQENPPSWATGSAQNYNSHWLAACFGTSFENDNGANNIMMNNDDSAHTHNFTLTEHIGTLTHASQAHKHAAYVDVPAHYTESFGDDSVAMTNMQPYLVCYIWKRTA